MPSVQTKDSDTDMKHQNYFWLPYTVEFVARGTTLMHVKNISMKGYGVPEFTSKVSMSCDFGIKCKNLTYVNIIHFAWNMATLSVP